MMNSIFLQIKNKHSFLDDINKLLDWNIIVKTLKRKTKQTTNATGEPSYSILKIFKIILLQIWFKLSDRQIAFAIFDSVLFRKFSGFLYKHRTHSYTTTCRFRNKLFELFLDREIFYLINKILRKNNLINNSGITIDSSVILSSRRQRKIVKINKNYITISYSDNTEAKWLNKNGSLFYGFKLHINTDILHVFITTPASYSGYRRILKISLS